MRRGSGDQPVDTLCDDRWVRRGINLGNVLDVDPVGALLAGVDELDLDVIVGAGFDTVRLPVRWTAFVGHETPFVIDESFAVEVDHVIGAALERHLEVVVDVHHANDVIEDPVSQEARFGAIWAQLGERFAGLPGTVSFELLNEPRPPMTAEQWNRVLRIGLEAVRRTNPTRQVIIGPAAMGTIAGLSALELPDDPHLVATIHHYEPFTFTHQGAPWEPGAESWLGTGWGTTDDAAAIRTALEAAAAWAEQRGVPLFIGEFGTYERAALPARARWTRAVRKEAERLGMAWCCWDFASDFGIFDPVTRSWRAPLRAALLDS
jgi:endoglucanase